MWTNRVRTVDRALLFCALQDDFADFSVVCYVGLVYPRPRFGLLSRGEAVRGEPAQYISMRAPETTVVVPNKGLFLEFSSGFVILYTFLSPKCKDQQTQAFTVIVTHHAGTACWLCWQLSYTLSIFQWTSLSIKELKQHFQCWYTEEVQKQERMELP